MATLFNTKIKDTYQSLLKLEDNTILTTTSKNITDGLGNASPLYMSTTRIGIGTNSPLYTADIAGNLRVTDGSFSLNYTGNSSNGSLVNAGTYPSFKVTNAAGVTRAILGSDGPNGYLTLQENGTTYTYLTGTATGNSGYSYFLSQLGVGTATTLGAKLSIKGTGSTSATTSLLVQNSSGTAAMTIKDDRSTNLNGGLYINTGITGGSYLVYVRSDFPNVELFTITENQSMYLGANATNLRPNGTWYSQGQYGTNFLANNWYPQGGERIGWNFGGNALAATGADSQISLIRINPTIGNFSVGTTNQGNALLITPTINQVNTGTHTIRGIYYNPTLTSLTGTTHVAIETVTGNVILGSTSGNLLVGTTTDNGYKLNVNGSINISGGNKLNFSNGSAQCWITNEGLTGLGSRSILIPGTGGGGGFVFYSDAGGPITTFDASGDSLSIRAGSSAVTAIMTINKSAASGYGGGSFIYYQTNSNNRMYTFGNPTNERGDESGSHTKVAAGQAGFLGNGGHVYLESGAKGTQVGSVDGNIIIGETRGNVGVGTATMSAKFHVKGTGSTSATSSLLVQNSGAVDLLKLQDNGDLTLGTFASGLGKIVVTCDPSYGTKTVMVNNFGGLIIRQISTDVLSFGGQQAVSLTAIGYLSLNAPFINGNNPLGNTTASSFNFRVNGSPYGQTPSTPSRGVLFDGGFGFQSGGYANYFELSPTYTFDVSNGRIVKGIYYNPTLVTPNTNDKHYGIQTTSGGAYINTTTPNAAAALQVDSTTQGVLFPRMTTAQKLAIVSPVGGLQVFDTTLNQMSYYNGSAWINF